MIARVELYNLHRPIPGTRRESGPVNGFYVALYEGNRRLFTLADCKHDEHRAFDLAYEFNRNPPMG